MASWASQRPGSAPRARGPQPEGDDGERPDDDEHEDDGSEADQGSEGGKINDPLTSTDAEAPRKEFGSS